MKPLTISDAETMILALQDEIRRSEDARYDHRLHAILLVAQGMSCREVAGKLGDSPRIVAYWVKQFEEIGFAGLSEGERPGRPSRLSEEQLDEIELSLRKSPLDCGLATNIWDGKTLSEHIQKKWGIEIGVRQCQRIFRRLGFRLRKPRSMIAHSDPEEQEAFKKTP
jgi:transposase